jgi:hypothetical protein
VVWALFVELFFKKPGICERNISLSKYFCQNGENSPPKKSLGQVSPQQFFFSGFFVCSQSIIIHRKM